MTDDSGVHQRVAMPVPRPGDASDIGDTPDDDGGVDASDLFD